MSTLYAVYEPSVEDQSVASLLLFETEAEARTEYDAAIRDGVANRAVGYYLARLDDLSPDDYLELVANPVHLVDQDFPGIASTTLEAFTVSAEDWAPGSLDTYDEDFDDSEDDYRVG